MGVYLRWACWQLFLILFQPSRFEHEVAGDGIEKPRMPLKECVFYLGKMAPVMTAIVLGGNLLIGLACEAYGINYNWVRSWQFAFLYLALGVAFGVGRNVAYGVALGVAFGVAFGVAYISSYFRLINYPINATLSTIAYFKAKRTPQTAFQAWRWCPVSWNELIWLPLPYLSDLLVLMTK